MDSLIGRTLGRYQILDEIGRGGMGVVYRAVDTTLHRDVALKILPPDLVADPDRRQRFFLEARTASRLEHPHICVIHEVGEADGATFIAMELVRGERLSDVLARGGMSTSHALQIATEVAEGLARAHEMGVVHRDVKPANVMITEEGHAKIIDFGLAKLVGALRGEASATTAAATEPGVVMGTMAYMSPEQARAGRVDHRSDIFSFGVMAYEMLSGRQPFHGHSGLETLNAILHTPAPPLPALGPAVSIEANADMQRIIEKCLAKDPAARYQGMRDVVVDLRAARRRLDSGPVTTVSAAPVAAPTAQASAAARYGRRRPLAIATVALIVVAIAGIVLWLQRFPASPAMVASGKPSVAVMHFENHTGKTDLDWLRTGLTEMVVTDLSQSPDIEVLPTDHLSQILTTLNRQNDRVLSLDTIQETARRAGVKYAIVGNYLKAGETIRINVTLQEAATGKIVSSEKVDALNEASLFATVDDLIRRIKTTFATRAGSGGPTGLIVPPGGKESLVFFRDLKEVTTASPEAYRYYVQGLDLQRAGLQREAVPLFEKAIAIDKDFALALVKLAAIHSNLGHPVQFEQYAQRAMDLTNRLTPRERYYIEGVYYWQKEATMQKAIDAFKNSLALYPNDDQAKHSLAVTYNRIGRTDEAIRLGEELRQRGVSNALTWTNLAETYVAVGQFEAARQVMDDHLRRTSPNAGSHRFWGWLLTVMGKGAPPHGAGQPHLPHQAEAPEHQHDRDATRRQDGLVLR
ncbi:MAG: protein kinase domain-containing protein [Acidobacteriota bacterium]